jgi:hypothetical protein
MGEKKYQLYAYRSDRQYPAGGLQDLGQDDDRQMAEVTARAAVRHDGFAAAQVMRTSDGRVVAYWDNEELA